VIRSSIYRIALALLVLVLGVATRVQAQSGCTTGNTGCSTTAPEIDPSLGAGGAALLAGAILVIRGRRRS
jgi:MYXO-CTERM domain-containing protein